MVFVDIVADTIGIGKDSSASVPDSFVLVTGFSEMINGLKTFGHKNNTVSYNLANNVFM